MTDNIPIPEMKGPALLDNPQLIVGAGWRRWLLKRLLRGVRWSMTIYTPAAQWTTAWIEPESGRYGFGDNE